MKKNVCLAALLAAVACNGAFAQQALKPGLWQVEMHMPGDPEFGKAMAEMREELASMSPEERKQMQAAMGQRGVQLDAGGRKGPVTKFCMSKEQAQRQEVTGAQGDCRVTKQARSGKTLTASFVCSNPKSTGDSVVTFAGPEAYTSKLTLVSEQGAKQEKTVMESEAKWLGADCGGLKPLGSAAK